MNNINTQAIPHWIQRLEEADLQFVKQLVLASGSLKQLAKQYKVSYPTIRLRLDRIIDRVKLFEANTDDSPFDSRVRLLVAEHVIDPSIGKELLDLHREQLGDAP